MSVWRSEDGRPRLVWRLALFALILALALSPLTLVRPQWLQLALAVCVFTAVLALWSRLIEKRSLSYFGLEVSARFFGECALGFGIGVCAVGAVFASLLMWGGTAQTSWHPETLTRSSQAAIGAFAIRMVMVGYWEETLFRGFLFRQFSESPAGPAQLSFRTKLAVALTSVLFGLAHAWTDSFSWAAFALLSVNGAGFAVPMLMTGRLGMSIGLHAAWNFAQSSIFGLPMSGNASSVSLLSITHEAPDWWSGGSYGPEAGLAGLLGTALMAILAWVACRTSERVKPQPEERM
ncbi:MAG: lysostaphin resistance A-like protein [Pseudomonadota bacterium]